MPFCPNCGHEVSDNAKFCYKCGVTMGTSGDSDTRKSVYDGEIHKCPNCGEVLKAFEINCPACGYELRGGKVSNTVKEFATQLATVESDVQKVVFIQSFPIPNTKEDILEFMILASTCFDAAESTAGRGSKKDVSDAWLAKVEQSYQKAKLLFGSDSDFTKIQNVYSQTYNRIKMTTDTVKKKRLARILLRTIGLWGGLIVFTIGFIIDITSHSVNTSVFHLGGMAVMIISATMLGRKSGEMIDAGVGAASGLMSLLLGMLLQGHFGGNGSALVLGGGATLIISVIQLLIISARR